jgi:ribose transport system substrate-binding protein
LIGDDVELNVGSMADGAANPDAITYTRKNSDRTGVRGGASQYCVRAGIFHPVGRSCWRPSHRRKIMAKDPNRITRRGALSMLCAGTGVLLASGARAQTKPRIPVIVKDATWPYWQTVLAGARKAGEDLGVEVVGLGARSEADVNGQIAILKDAAASAPAAIVIAPTQFAALGKPIDEAAKQVKVIGIDSAADTKAMAALVATDNVQAGRMAADALAAAIKRSYADAEGDVAIIAGTPGVPALDDRTAGFKEQLAAKYGALAIVAQPAGDGRPETGAKLMADLIANHPELRGVFASNLAMTRGAAEVLARTANNTTGDKINLVGCDAADGFADLLQHGTIAALVMQDPFRIGYDGVKTALAAARGGPFPAKVDIGATLITKANLNAAQAQALLHPPR